MSQCWLTVLLIASEEALLALFRSPARYLGKLCLRPGDLGMVAPKKRLLHNKTLSFSSSTFIDIDLHIDDSLLASLGRCASERLQFISIELMVSS